MQAVPSVSGVRFTTLLEACQDGKHGGETHCGGEEKLEKDQALWLSRATRNWCGRVRS